MKRSAWRRIPGNWNFVLRIFARRPEDDVDAELRFHFDDIGHRIVRRQRRAEWWEDAAQSLRITLRGLRRSPGFLVMSILSLGVGIGLSTATFAYVEASMNPKLPYADPARLRSVTLEVARWQHKPEANDLIAILRDLPSVEAVTELEYETHKELRGNGLSGRADISRFAPNFFEVTGLRPLLGRWPRADESRAGNVAVVSAYVWSHGFRNRPEIGDAHIILDGVTMPIVGVLPRAVYLGSSVWIPYSPQAWVDSARDATWNRLFIRLKKGVPRAALDGQLAAAAARLKSVTDTRPGGRRFVLSLNSYYFAGHRPDDREITLIGVALGILLIGATNVAALALARSHARRRDVALRVALGASRAVIVRELLTEVGVISALGAVCGGAFSAALIGVLTYMTPENLMGDYGLRLPVLTPNIFIYVFIGLIASIAIAGGVPAWRASQVDPADPLKDNAGTTTGRARSEFRFLLIGELALAMALITITTLLLVSTNNLAAFDFGFDLRRLVEARVSYALPPVDKRHPVDSLLYYASALARVRATPGVAMATTFMPAAVGAKEIISRPKYGAEHTLEPDGGYYDVGPDAFRTLAIPILEGHDFTEGDRVSGDKVILAERAAKALFPRKNAIGSTIKIGGVASKYPWMRVIGVVPDIRIYATDRAGPETFVSTRDAVTQGNLAIVIRPAAMDPQFMNAVDRALAGALPPNSSVLIHPMSESFERQVEVTRFFTRTLTFIGVCALLLAVLGLFSVLSFTVGRRMREFAVRLALGATPRQVLMVVMKDGFETALGGTAIGALLSFWASAGLSGMFFGMTITDPIALIIAEAALLLAATVASLVPGMRATKADPMDVLRAI
jgi:predicted permease